MRDEKGRFEKGNRLQDLTNQKFGRLIAIKVSEKRSGRKTYWDCVCDCGKIKTVRTDSLKSGKVRSCGCLKKEQDSINLPNGQGVVTHGLSKERIYGIWRGMKSRCQDTDNKKYHNYGGRGINVCKEWQDVKIFYKWALENGYEEDLTIERINVNGNYEPSNCTWATWKEQANNKTNSLFIEHEGRVKTLAQWSEDTGIPYGTLKSRMNYGIKTPMLFEKEEFIRKDNTLIMFNGETRTMTQWSEITGVKLGTISERHRRGIKPPHLFHNGNLINYK